MKSVLYSKWAALVGGFLCLALAVPAAARADDRQPSASPEETVQRLAAAAKSGDGALVKALLEDEPDNRGREELLAFLDMTGAQGELKEAVNQKFGRGSASQLGLHELTDVRITIVRKTVICGVVQLRLRVTLLAAGLLEETREVDCYVGDEGRLDLPGGFLTSSEEESQLFLEYIRLRTGIYRQIAQRVRDGKYQTVREVAAVLPEAEE